MKQLTKAVAKKAQKKNLNLQRDWNVRWSLRTFFGACFATALVAS